MFLLLLLLYFFAGTVFWLFIGDQCYYFSATSDKLTVRTSLVESAEC